MSGTDTSPAKDVFDLLNKLQSLGATTVGKLQEEAIHEIEPDISLLHPWEPGFVTGYQIKTSGGHIITLEDIWQAYVGGENILLTGPSGTGKSSLAFHLMDRANESTRVINRKIFEENVKLLKAGTPKDELQGYHPLPYQISHYSCHEATRSEELIGTVTIMIMPDGSRRAVVVRGAVVEAWTEGKTLILEEKDLAAPGVWGETHQFFDGRTKETTIYVNGPERIKKHDRFRVIATANTLGRGENQIEFAGTQMLNTAFLNRFTYIVKLGWLPRDEEINLVIAKTGIRIDIAAKMIDAATQARKAHEESVCDTTISTRDLLSWSRECLRKEKRTSVCASVSEYWSKVAIPSAFPTFLSRIVDKSTQEAFGKFLSIR
jgi:MoxR-like ATPase